MTLNNKRHSKWDGVNRVKDCKDGTREHKNCKQQGYDVICMDCGQKVATSYVERWF